MITVSLVRTTPRATSVCSSTLRPRTSLALQPRYASGPVIMLYSHDLVYGSLIHLEKLILDETHPSYPLIPQPPPFLSCCSFAKLCLTPQPHGLQHTGLLYSLPSPRVSSASCLLGRWCSLTVSAAPFSSCLQSSPALGSFPMSWLFALGGQSVGASATALPEVPTYRYARFYCGAQIPPVLLKGVGVSKVIQVAWRRDGKSHSDQKCSGSVQH